MLALLAKWRIVKGWGAADGQQTMAQAAVFVEVMERHRIPAEQYEALYNRFVDSRARALSVGGRADDLSPEALVGLWAGQNGLGAELAEKRPSLPAPDCGDCLNTGWVVVVEGCYRGVKECGCGRKKR